MRRFAPFLLLLAAACSSGSSHAASPPTPKAAPSQAAQTAPSCDTIKLGGAVDNAMLDTGCFDKARDTTYALNGSTCRTGGRFGTFDYHDPKTGQKTDQLFAYKGTWHSTNKEPKLYDTAFGECL